MFDHVGAVHRLKQEVFERHPLEALGRRFGLRIDEFEFVPARYGQFRI
jgi:hypothetical protein